MDRCFYLRPMRGLLFSSENSWSRRAQCCMGGSCTHLRHSLFLPHGTRHRSPSETFLFSSSGKREDKTGEKKMQKSLSNPTTFSLKTGISRKAGAPWRCFQCAGNTLWQDMGMQEGSRVCSTPGQPGWEQPPHHEREKRRFERFVQPGRKGRASSPQGSNHHHMLSCGGSS